MNAAVFKTYREIRLEAALHKCREEFCWHGNTGKRLNQQCYGDLVDMIDAALQPEEGDLPPT